MEAIKRSLSRNKYSKKAQWNDRILMFKEIFFSISVILPIIFIIYMICSAFTFNAFE
ncbi:MAG: hypothetical protein HYU67_04025 [Flavobacteriia bacterium]|nr:hypothetical protein [Flavobacteriia bacterium]